MRQLLDMYLSADPSGPISNLGETSLLKLIVDSGIQSELKIQLPGAIKRTRMPSRKPWKRICAGDYQRCRWIRGIMKDESALMELVQQRKARSDTLRRIYLRNTKNWQNNCIRIRMQTLSTFHQHSCRNGLYLIIWITTKSSRMHFIHRSMMFVLIAGLEVLLRSVCSQPASGVAWSTESPTKKSRTHLWTYHQNQPEFQWRYYRNSRHRVKVTKKNIRNIHLAVLPKGKRH